MKQNIIIAIAAIVIFVVYTLGVYGKGTKDERGKWELRLSEAQAASEKSMRKKESILNAEIERLTNQARQDEKNYIAVIDTANAAANSLREQADIYAAKADSCPTTTGRGNSGTSCALLAQLFGEADARAGQLAETADRAIMAGGKCVQMYGAIKNQR